ncbi:hypothetical protein [Leifsonia sp. Leaf264]|uniref:hypothetical protein n=1 Tax=Leifsonia sp. Leaf264 TaxID=1736314 RepID=UPI0006F9626E|nr:hypothetical protein [Leifsonia sp. Leaf264]KQO98789.1 hypothetical protein ASF30_12055 [Leifsonia sp. Leaf264]
MTADSRHIQKTSGKLAGSLPKPQSGADLELSPGAGILDLDNPQHAAVIAQFDAWTAFRAAAPGNDNFLANRHFVAMFDLAVGSAGLGYKVVPDPTKPFDYTNIVEQAPVGLVETATADSDIAKAELDRATANYNSKIRRLAAAHIRAAYPNADAFQLRAATDVHGWKEETGYVLDDIHDRDRGWLDINDLAFKSKFQDVERQVNDALTRVPQAGNPFGTPGAHGQIVVNVS